MIGSRRNHQDSGLISSKPTYPGIKVRPAPRGILLATRLAEETMSTAADASRQQMLNRVRGEFLEMPGLRLRLEQAQRLWGLDRPTCEELLLSLVDTKFLSRRGNDVYGLL